MIELTVKQYAKVVAKSKLIPQDQLERVLQRCAEQTGPDSTDWRPLARMLIRESLLTEWQHKKLVKGKYKGFFLGKYKLLSLLGTGGMSRVFLAEHTVMLRRVALKILPEHLVKDQKALDRFYRESQAIAAVDHRNIVRAYDVDNEGDIHYLVMEYVDGPDLAKLVEKEGQLDYLRAADYIHQAAEGLSHAHSKDMIHRDIKPANLLITSEDVVKILDMGLAQFGLAGDGPSSVGDATVLGTTDYMSPEQALGSKETDPRSDIYSLGCTLYFLLTAQVPFPDCTMAEVLLKHQMEYPTAITAFRDDVPADLIDICWQMMAKSRDDRYSSAALLAEELGQWLSNYQAWQSDPELFAQRPPDEEWEQEQILIQTHRDKEERASRRSSPATNGQAGEDSIELQGFFERLSADQDTLQPDSDPEMGQFFESLEEEREQRQVRRRERRPSPGAPPGTEESSPRPAPPANRPPPKRPPVGRPSTGRAPAPPRRSSRTPDAEDPAVFLNQLEQKPEETVDAGDPGLQAFLSDLARDQEETPTVPPSRRPPPKRRRPE